MIEVISIKRHAAHTIKIACPECGMEITHYFGANAFVKETVELMCCKACAAHFDVELRL